MCEDPLNSKELFAGLSQYFTEKSKKGETFTPLPGFFQMSYA
jgi:hypothetical protein